jgi:glycosyltransferase involved in cell wall biosynthesis
VYRIGFDGTPLVGPRTGVGWYTHDLVDAVARRSPDDDLVVLPLSFRTPRTLPLELPRRPNVSLTRRPVPARALWAMWERAAFPPVEWLVKCDVFHATNFICPPSRRVPTVVTVHDIGFVRHPGPVPAAVRRMAHLLPTVLRRASVVVAVSRFTRDELAAWLPEVADRICVIPNGSHRRAAAPSAAGLPPGPPYALMVGTLEPRKNVALALDALRILRDQDRELRLVLAGSPSPLLDLAAELRGRGVGPLEVVATGYVDDGRMAALMAGARLLVFPSRYEGFGMPVVEALESGLPVVAARAGATPEIAGDAAVLVDPADPEGFADAMWRVATDESLRATLVAAGRRRATEFSWDRAAAASLRVYHSLAG